MLQHSNIVVCSNIIKVLKPNNNKINWRHLRFFLIFNLCFVVSAHAVCLNLPCSWQATAQPQRFTPLSLDVCSHVTFPVGQWSQVSTQSQNQSRTLAENQQNHARELRKFQMQFKTKQNMVCHLVPQNNNNKNTPCWVPRYCKPLLLSVFQMQFRTKQGLSPCAAKYPLLSA